jgi:hypothetical protein
MKKLTHLVSVIVMAIFPIGPAVKVVIRRVIVALNFPREISKFIEYAGKIHNSMTANAAYAASAAKLATLATDLATLVADETATETKPPTKTKADRNTALNVVKNDLRSLRSDVQALCDATPSNALQLIADSGMSVKKETLHSKSKGSAKDGEVLGSVELEGDGPGPHEFQMSTDNKTWIALPSSRTRKTVILGLTSGTLYYFQNRQMLTKGLKTAWTESITLRVK